MQLLIYSKPVTCDVLVFYCFGNWVSKYLLQSFIWLTTYLIGAIFLTLKLLAYNHENSYKCNNPHAFVNVKALYRGITSLLKAGTLKIVVWKISRFRMSNFILGFLTQDGSSQATETPTNAQPLWWNSQGQKKAEGTRSCQGRQQLFYWCWWWESNSSLRRERYSFYNQALFAILLPFVNLHVCFKGWSYRKSA